MRLLQTIRRAFAAPAARPLASASALFLILFAAQTAQAATFTVNTTADTIDATTSDGVCADAGGLCSLRAAISQANALAGDDIITLPAGTYTATIAGTNENANTNGDFDFASNITLNGAGSGSTFIQANAAPNTATERVIDVNAVAATIVNISGVTIRNGSAAAARGGGIRNFATLTLTNSVVSANRAISTTATATLGGGIVNETGTMTLNNVDVTGNTCSGAAATSCNGAGIYHFGSPTNVLNIINSRITNNVGTAGGTNAFASGSGFLAQSGGTVNITGSTISGNVGNGTGGGGSTGAGIRYATLATGPNVLNVTDTTISGNGSTTNGTTHNGSGVNISAPAAGSAGTYTGTFNNVTIRDNVGTNQGAGVQVSGAIGTTTFNDSRINSNSLVSASAGGALGGGFLSFSGATATFNRTTISGNSTTSTAAATVGGGACILGGTTTTFNDSVISGNTAASTSGTGAGFGGGIYQEASTLTLNNSGVSGNTATTAGGVYTTAVGAAATINVSRSSITRNTALDNGGGMLVSSEDAVSATANINNSTVGNNSAANNGGGINSFATSTGNVAVNLTFSTVAANNADGGGGGIVNFGGSGTGTVTIGLQNSVIADNTAANGTSPDISGAFFSRGYNLIENTSGGTITDEVPALVAATGDQTGVDPSLAPLASNGSATTFSYRPLAGSVLLDAIPSGTSGCGTAPFNIDQRGAVRPNDSNNDGAAACEKGSFEVAPGGPTAGEIVIGGRVLTDTGRGIRGVRVTLTDSSGATRTTMTTTRGTYRFIDAAAGETYVITAKGARYTFGQPSQVLNASEDTDAVNFVANPGRGR